MRSLALRHRWSIAATALAVVVSATDSPAIEMFTYFGDGSRIGLPSLEVPIEAYPGIPLRSDRIRARRRAQRMGPNAAVRIGPPGYARGITVRAMPTIEHTAPAPRSGGMLPAEPPIAPEPMLLGAEPPAVPAAAPAKQSRGGAETIPAPDPER